MWILLCNGAQKYRVWLFVESEEEGVKQQILAWMSVIWRVGCTCVMDKSLAIR
jgi:hypothetical protein